MKVVQEQGRPALLASVLAALGSEAGGVQPRWLRSPEQRKGSATSGPPSDSRCSRPAPRLEPLGTLTFLGRLFRLGKWSYARRRS